MTATTLHIVPLIISAFTFCGFCEAIFSYSHLKRSLLTLKTKENIKIWMSRESSNHLSCLGDSRKTTKGLSYVQWQVTFRVTKNKSQDLAYLDHMPLVLQDNKIAPMEKVKVKRFKFCLWTFSCLAVCQFIFTWNNAWLTGLCLETRLLFEHVCLVTIHNLECTDVSLPLWKRALIDKLLVATLGLSEGHEHHSSRMGGMWLMVVKAALKIFST